MYIKGKTIAIDFDDTIHDTANTEWPRLGEPLTGARVALRKLHALKCKVIIFSARAVTSGIVAEMESWMDKHKMPFDHITNVKPQADYFVDDRAVRFKGDWSETFRELNVYAKVKK